MPNKKNVSSASAVKPTVPTVKPSEPNEMDFLKAQIEEQNKKIETLTNALLLAKANNTSSKSDKFVKIGSREINGTPIVLSNRVVYVKYGEQNAVKLKEDEVRYILNSADAREYLAKGILYFADESDYEYFDVVRTYDMSDDTIVSMIKKSPNDMVNDFVKFTSNKLDAPVTHCLFYRIVEMIMSSRITTLSYETRIAIERFFNFNIDQAIAMLNIIKSV